MNKSWFDKYTPNKLTDLMLSSDKLTKIDDWMNQLNKKKGIKLLLIQGPSGSGKSLLAKLIMKHYNYESMIYDCNTQNEIKIDELFKFSLTYRNVEEMFNKKKKKGIILDNIKIDYSSKSSSAEIKTLTKILKENRKGRNKIESPIICIENNFKTKTIKTLKKYSVVLTIPSPSNYKLECIANKIFKKQKIKIDIDVKLLLLNYIDNDIRQLINVLYYISNNNKNNKLTLESFEKIKDTIKKKDPKYQLYTAANKFMNNRLTYIESDVIYNTISMILPLLVFDNFYKKKNDDIVRILTNISDIDIIQNKIIKTQNYRLSYINQNSIYDINYLINKKKKRIDVTSSTLLNKCSEYYVARKKKSIDNYLFTEIISKQ